MNTMQTHLQLGCIILCGGKSRRMGCNKSQLLFSSVSLLENVIQRVAPLTDPIAIVGSVDTEIKSRYPKILYLQDQQQNCGPLEGIRVGMRALIKQVDYVLVVACDNPLISREVIELLYRRVAQSDGAVAVIDGKLKPLPGIYKTNCLPWIESMVLQNELAVKNLAAELKLVQVKEKELRSVDANLSSFLNVNTPEDYLRLLEGFS